MLVRKSVKNKSSWIVGAVLLVLAACTPATSAIPVTGNDETQTPVVENTLANTSWQLTSFGPRDDQMQVLPETQITLQFNENLSTAGSGGCNGFSARYTLLSDQTLTISDIVSTEMACTDAGITQQEQKYFNALQSGARFQRSDDELTIWYNGGWNALHFTRAGSGTPVQPTLTVVPVTPTFADPTSTPLSAVSTDRITFGPGFTSATVKGSLSASGSDQYVLRAFAGQTLNVNVSTSEGEAILVVWGADGTVLLTDHAEVSSLERVLPATQDYFITVKGRPAGATVYSMTVSIPAIDTGAERIEFANGSISATVTGRLNAAGSHDYVLRALSGQTLTIDTTFTEGRAILEVWGQDGTVLLTGHAEASSFVGVLPTTQDYFIMVQGRPDGGTRYSMTVSVTSTNGGIEQIEFAPGSSSTTVSAQLVAAGSKEYVLRAFEGQTLNIDMTFSEGRAILAVWGANGNVLLSDHAQASTFEGVLPSTQDYHILVKGRPGGSTTYSMTISLPPP